MDIEAEVKSLTSALIADLKAEGLSAEHAAEVASQRIHDAVSGVRHDEITAARAAEPAADAEPAPATDPAVAADTAPPALAQLA